MGSIIRSVPVCGDIVILRWLRASAYLSMLQMRPLPEVGMLRACFDALVRRAEPVTDEVSSLLANLRSNDLAAITAANEQSRVNTLRVLGDGPESWVLGRFDQQLLRPFSVVNLRSVLPEREPGLWNPSLSRVFHGVRARGSFPSQIDAIRVRLLENGPNFTLQMPTGAVKPRSVRHYYLYRTSLSRGFCLCLEELAVVIGFCRL